MCKGKFSLDSSFFVKFKYIVWCCFIIIMMSCTFEPRIVTLLGSFFQHFIIYLGCSFNFVVLSSFYSVILYAKGNMVEGDRGAGSPGE